MKFDEILKNKKLMIGVGVITLILIIIIIVVITSGNKETPLPPEEIPFVWDPSKGIEQLEDLTTLENGDLSGADLTGANLQSLSLKKCITGPLISCPRNQPSGVECVKIILYEEYQRDYVSDSSTSTSVGKNKIEQYWLFGNEIIAKNSNLFNIVLIDQSYQNIDFQNSYIERCDFNLTAFKNCNFKNSSIQYNQFINSNLTDSDFSNTICSFSNFTSCNLTGVDLSNSNLKYTNFKKALLGVVLYQTEIDFTTEIDFETNFSGINYDKSEYIFGYDSEEVQWPLNTNRQCLIGRDNRIAFYENKLSDLSLIDVSGLIIPFDFSGVKTGPLKGCPSSIPFPFTCEGFNADEEQIESGEREIWILGPGVILTGANLTGFDLSDNILLGTVFNNVVLTNVNLENTKLANIDFSSVIFDNTITSSIVSCPSLLPPDYICIYTDLTNIILGQNVILRDITLDNNINFLEFPNVNLSGMTIENSVQFKSPTLGPMINEPKFIKLPPGYTTVFARKRNYNDDEIFNTRYWWIIGQNIDISNIDLRGIDMKGVFSGPYKTCPFYDQSEDENGRNKYRCLRFIFRDKGEENHLIGIDITMENINFRSLSFASDAISPIDGFQNLDLSNMIFKNVIFNPKTLFIDSKLDNVIFDNCDFKTIEPRNCFKNVRTFPIQLINGSKELFRNDVNIFTNDQNNSIIFTVNIKLNNCDFRSPQNITNKNDNSRILLNIDFKDQLIGLNFSGINLEGSDFTNVNLNNIIIDNDTSFKDCILKNTFSEPFPLDLAILPQKTQFFPNILYKDETQGYFILNSGFPLNYIIQLPVEYIVDGDGNIIGIADGIDLSQVDFTFIRSGLFRGTDPILPLGYSNYTNFIGENPSKFVLGPNVSLDNIQFNNCDLIDADFTNVDLSKVDIINVKLSGPIYKKTNIPINHTYNENYFYFFNTKDNEELYFITKNLTINNQFKTLQFNNLNFGNLQADEFKAFNNITFNDINFTLTEFPLLLTNIVFQNCNLTMSRLDTQFSGNINFLNCNFQSAYLHIRNFLTDV